MLPAIAGAAISQLLDMAAGPSHAAPVTPGNRSDSLTHRKLEKASGEFESLLLASLWKSMKQSFDLSEEGQSDAAHGTLEDWGIEIMAGAVGKAGGLGIGKLILKHLEATDTVPKG